MLTNPSPNIDPTIDFTLVADDSGGGGLTVFFGGGGVDAPGPPAGGGGVADSGAGEPEVGGAGVIAARVSISTLIP